MCFHLGFECVCKIVFSPNQFSQVKVLVCRPCTLHDEFRSQMHLGTQTHTHLSPLPPLSPLPSSLPPSLPRLVVTGQRARRRRTVPSASSCLALRSCGGRESRRVESGTVQDCQQRAGATVRGLTDGVESVVGGRSGLAA